MTHGTPEFFRFKHLFQRTLDRHLITIHLPAYRPTYLSYSQSIYTDNTSQIHSTCVHTIFKDRHSSDPKPIVSSLLKSLLPPKLDHELSTHKPSLPFSFPPVWSLIVPF